MVGYWIGKGVEGNGYNLIWGTALAFGGTGAHKNLSQDNESEAKIWAQNFLNIKPECSPLDGAVESNALLVNSKSVMFPTSEDKFCNAL